VPCRHLRSMCVLLICCVCMYVYVWHVYGPLLSQERIGERPWCEVILRNRSRISQGYHLVLSQPFATNVKPNGRVQPKQVLRITIWAVQVRVFIFLCWCCLGAPCFLIEGCDKCDGGKDVFTRGCCWVAIRCPPPKKDHSHKFTKGTCEAVSCAVHASVSPFHYVSLLWNGTAILRFSATPWSFNVWPQSKVLVAQRWQ